MFSIGLRVGFSLFIIILILASGDVRATLVQILHTNDLHGFLEHSVMEKDRGGYATLKTLIDKEKAKAKARGIETLVLDAGDFLEGSLFYTVEDGRRVFNIMNLMGYDAVVVGNHDWLMGTKELSELMTDVPPKFAYLGANFKVHDPRYKNINENMKDYIVKEIGGVKIAIMGVVTNEVFYSWRLKGGKIKKPVKVSKKLSKRIHKKKEADFIISLNHAGLWKDKMIIQETKHIDLIVGGHTHTALQEVHYEINKDKKEVPIVQAGEHGKYLGRLLIDVVKGQPLKVVDYKLLKVLKKDHEADPVVEDYVTETRKILEKEYGAKWLNEIVGHSAIPLHNSHDRLTIWSMFITDAIKESVGADISVHSPGFAGTDMNAGAITREELINTYPRYFDLKNRDGWHVYQVDAYGVVLKSLIRVLLKGQRAVNFSGITFDIMDRENDEIFVDMSFVGNDEDHPYNGRYLIDRYLGIDGDYRVTNIRVNGEPINALRKYRLALPEGVVSGGLGISGVVKYLLRKISKTEITIRQALENHLKKVGTLDEHYQYRYLGGEFNNK